MKTYPHRLPVCPWLLAAGSAFAADKVCKVDISGTDQMQFDKKEIAVAADCTEVEVTLKHAGKLPAQAMGHNWVLAKTADVAGVASDGMGAGLRQRPHQERRRARDRAHQDGRRWPERPSVKFPTSALKKGEAYSFFCTFPGHSAHHEGRLQVRLIDGQAPRRPAAAIRARTARGQPVSRPEPRHRQPAGVRRAGARPGAEGGAVPPSTTDASCIRCTRISCGAAISPSPSSTASIAAATAAASRRGAWWRSRTASRSSSARRRSRSRSRASNTRRARRRCRRPRSSKPLTKPPPAELDKAAGETAALARDRAAVRIPPGAAVQPAGARGLRAGAPDLDARGRQTTRRRRRCIAACWPTSPTTGCSTPRRCRTAPRSCAATWSWRASITRSGFTARRASTTGCCTASTAQSSSGARGFARGSFYSRDGVLVASTAQEGLIRLVQPQS